MSWHQDSEEAGLILNMSQAFSQGMSEGESPFSISPMDRKDNVGDTNRDHRIIDTEGTKGNPSIDGSKRVKCSHATR